METKNNFPLFLEDIYEALRATVQALGGAKAVAGKLWPHKPLDQAHRELLDALNRDNPRKLDPEETLALLKMAREAGFHRAKHWIDQELGYDPTPPTDPVLKADRLASVIENATATLVSALKQAQELQQSSPSEKVRAVK